MSEMTVAEALAEMKRNDPHRSPAGYANLLRLAIEALAREKADAVPKARDVAAGDWATVSLSEWFRNAQRGEVAEKERDAALGRAEAAEAAEKELERKRNGMTDLSNRLEMTGECLRAAEKERDALRADRDGLAELNALNKAELARWRNAAAALRALFAGTYPEGFVVPILDRAEKP